LASAKIVPRVTFGLNMPPMVYWSRKVFDDTILGEDFALARQESESQHHQPP
jgi:hypothetical protein